MTHAPRFLTMTLAVFCVVASLGPVRAQAPGERAWKVRYFAGYGEARRVTITRNGEVLSTLNVPRGVYLSIYHNDERPTFIAYGQRFEGAVQIRTRPRREVSEGGSRRADDVMADAPFVLTLDDVDVTVALVTQ